MHKIRNADVLIHDNGEIEISANRKDQNPEELGTFENWGNTSKKGFERYIMGNTLVYLY